MGITSITVRGARQHNLKNISVEIPRNTLTVITGLSGSGKSSLAFDTIYAEGQRRYVETLSAYARQFLDQMERPDVDTIDGLSPSIAIEQKTTSRSPRSTVGTITEIYDYLRLLYSSIGVPHCPQCGRAISRQSAEQIVQQVMDAEARGPGDDPGAHRARAQGRVQEGARQAGAAGLHARPHRRRAAQHADEEIKLDKRKNHTIELVVDRLLVKPGIERRLAQSVEMAMKLANGLVQVAVVGGEERLYSSKLACPECGINVPVLEPRSFSFNSMYGACPECNGLGSKYDFDPAKVIVDWSKPLLDGGLGPGSASQTPAFAACNWRREAYGFNLTTPFEQLPRKTQNLMLYGPEQGEKKTRRLPRRVRLSAAGDGGEHVRGLSRLAAGPHVGDHVSGVPRQAAAAGEPGGEGERHVHRRLHGAAGVARRGSGGADQADPSARSASPDEFCKEIAERLGFLNAVGLGYISLDRSAATLERRRGPAHSPGHADRIEAARRAVCARRALDRTAPSRQRPPAASAGIVARSGQHRAGGRARRRHHSPRRLRHRSRARARAVTAAKWWPAARPQQIEAAPRSLTGQYISGQKQITYRYARRQPNGKAITILGARENNLKNLDVSFPLGVMTVVTGVSGSGKSTLVNDILYRALAKALYRSREEPGAHKAITGTEYIDKVIRIDQSPIGRTPRSNPATYTGVFTQIRDLYAMLPESRERGYKAGRFSFNVAGGRCEACQGEGQRRIEMNFLPDVYVLCEVCGGKRYNHETLAVKYKGYSIADLLETPVADALPILENIPQIKQKLQTLVDVGLGYIHLGQSAVTLSGGEAQRIKLARELSKRQTGKTLYLLDEPTTGLHFDDVSKLLEVLHRLTDLGNSIIIIEHNMDVIRNADWIIDLGPEGGEDGGRMVAQGTPEQVARVKKSYTGQTLAKLLAALVQCEEQRVKPSPGLNA